MKRAQLAWLLYAALCSGCSDDSDKTSDSNDAGLRADAGAGDQDAGSGDATVDQDASRQDAATGRDAGPPAPGSCTPGGGTDWAGLMPSAQSLASSLSGKFGFLGVASGQVYLIDSIGNNGQTQVIRVPVAGGSPQTVLMLAVEGAHVVLGDTHLYYALPTDQTAGYPIRSRVPLSAPESTPQTITAASPSAPLLIQGDTLYGYKEADGTFWRQAFADAAPTTLGTRKGEEPTTFALLTGYLYYPNAAFGGESLRRLRLADGNVEQLSKAINRTAQPLLLDQGTAYWGGAGPLFATAVEPKGETRQLGITSGIDSFSNLAREPVQLALHGERLYWVDEEGSVAWASLDASTCDGILSTSLGDSFELDYLLDGDFLYVLHQPSFEPAKLWRYPLP